MTNRPITSPEPALWSTPPCCTTLLTNTTAAVIQPFSMTPQWHPTLPPPAASTSVPGPLWANCSKVLRLVIPVWCRDSRRCCHSGSRRLQDSSTVKLMGGLGAGRSQVEVTMRSGLPRRSQSNKRTSAMPTWRMVSDTVSYCSPEWVSVPGRTCWSVSTHTSLTWELGGQCPTKPTVWQSPQLVARVCYFL